MSFPIQFSKPAGSKDLISPVINFIGNASFVVCNSIMLTAISLCALKALGFQVAEKITANIAAPIIQRRILISLPVSASLIFIAMMMGKALEWHRQQKACIE